MSSALKVSEGLLGETFAHLRLCGRGEVECVAYWAGPISEPNVASCLLTPRHVATPAFYEIDSSSLTAMWLRLALDELELRAQIHTHGGRAFHSATDDAYAIVQTEGFRSLVIPYSAFGPEHLDGCYLAEIGPSGNWISRDPFGSLELVSNPAPRQDVLPPDGSEVEISVYRPTLSGPGPSQGLD